MERHPKSMPDPMRRRLVAGLALAALEASLAARAAPPPGKFRVAIDRGPDVVGGVSSGLSKLGYVEGKNLEIVSFRGKTDEELDRLLASAPVDSINALVTLSSVSALSWDKRLRNVPIVAWGVMDPVEEGIAKSFTRPGGNITGTTQGWEESCRKQVDILRMFVPGLTGIAVFYGYADVQPLPYVLARELELFQYAVREAGFKVLTVRYSDVPALAALENLRKHGFQAAIYGTVPATLKNQPEVVPRHVRAAIRYRIAAIGGPPQLADLGFLAAYGELSDDWWLRIAQQLDRIFRGTKVGDIPFINPSRYHLRVNRRTASALGLTIPPEVLVMADHIVD